MSQVENVLRLEHVTMQFGGVVAVNDLSLEVNQGEIVALIGPNGAGKTTAFNCITGVYEPTNGRISFLGEPMVENHPQGRMQKLYQGENQGMFSQVLSPTPDRITQKGIARTFQNIRLFSALTVFENVLIAKHMRARQNVFSAAFRLNRAEEKRMREEAMSLLEEQNLAHLKDEVAGSLPYGLQRHLEIARALATAPKLLLLDEPAAGMNPQETQELTDFIHKIRDEYDLSILMIEHHMDWSCGSPTAFTSWTSASRSPRAHRRRSRTILGSSRHIWGWQTMLKIDELKVSYGGIEAVKGITFEVPERQIVTLIGANGAGKSTTLRTIAGLVKPAHGRIHLQGEDITGLSPDRIVSKGVTLVPEGRRVFPDLSVVENLKIGAYLRKDDLEDDLNWVYDLFPRLKERSWQAAGTLSGGEQQMLAVARALMSRPKIIMMDEPSLGLAPLVVKGIFEIIQEINKQGVTVLLIEQNDNMALKIADLGYVLETGRITLTGSGRDLLKNEDVKKAYLGT